LIIRAFEIEKARVRYPFEVKGETGVIEQIDGAIHATGLHALIEAKDWKEGVGVEPIAKLRLRLARRPPGTIGVVFSVTRVTEPALEIVRLSSPLNVLIWQDDEIREALRRRKMVVGLQIKYYHAVESAVPDFNLLQLEEEQWK
jgi:hypothetical protein